MKGTLKIRKLAVEDVGEGYVNWFKEQGVTEYSDNQYRKFTLEGQKGYVKLKNSQNNTQLFGIFYGSIHIGNIVLERIDSNHKRAELTYVIGNKDYWGKGIATDVIGLIVIKAKQDFGLVKLNASCADKNEGSKKVLLKNNFKIEGIKKKHLFYNNEWMDQIDFGLLL